MTRFGETELHYGEARWCWKYFGNFGLADSYLGLYRAHVEAMVRTMQQRVVSASLGWDCARKRSPLEVDVIMANRGRFAEQSHGDVDYWLGTPDR